MKNRINFFGIIALAAITAIVLGGCGGAGNANPATDFSYDLTADGQGIKITGYTGTSTSVVVPEMIENLPVVEIGKDVFNGLTVTIGGTINYLTRSEEENKNALLTFISLPDTVTTLGTYVFANTPLLTEVKLSENINYISMDAFQKSGIKKVNLPKNLQKIGFGAFAGCGELTELIIPDTMSEIKFMGYGHNEEDVKEDSNNYAFERCGKLPIAIRQKIQGWGYSSVF